MGKLNKFKNFFEYGTLTSIGAKMYTDKNGVCNLTDRITKIGENAFNDQKYITKISGKNVKEIENNVFEDCERLQECELPELRKIGEFGFANSGLTEINFNKLQEAGSGAFKDCKKLKEVELNEIEKINYGLFSQCSNLESVKLEKAKYIDSYAFKDCSKLNLVRFKNVETIKENAFEGCESLISIDLNNIKTIEGSVFKNCKNLKSINLFNIEEIGENVFDGCENLECIYTPNMTIGCKIYKDLPDEIKNKSNFSLCYLTELGYKEINNKSNSRQEYLIQDEKCNILGEVINKEIFENEERKFKKVSGEKVKEIGDEAFKDFKELEEVDLRHVKKIGKSAFEGCENLRGNFVLTSNLEIGDNAFKDCKLIEEIKILGLEKIGSNVFEGCNDKLKITTHNIEQSKRIYDSLSDELKKKIKIFYGPTLSRFYEVINDNELIIYDNCYEDVSGYSELLNRVEKISAPNLEIIDVSGCEEEIFKNLKYLYIPKIKIIDKSVLDFLENCDQLKEIIVKDEKGKKVVEEVLPAEMRHIIKLDNECKKSLDYSQTCDVKYGVYELSDDITKIEDEQYKDNCYAIEVYGKGVCEIGNNAFEGCKRLEKCGLISVKKIGNLGFAGTKLEVINFPDLEEVGKGVFKECKELRKIALNTLSKVETINDDLFNGCEGLESVELDKAKYIGDRVFKNCNNLKSISLISIKEIGEEVFDGCESLKYIRTSDMDKGNLIYKKLPDEIKGKKDFYIECLCDEKGICRKINIQDFEEYDLRNDGILRKSYVKRYIKNRKCILPDNIRKISDKVFVENKDITEIRGNNVKEIGEGVFSGCSELETAILCNVKRIGDNAFEGCKKLRCITLGKLTSVGQNVFSGCDKLLSINVGDIDSCELIYNSLDDSIKERLLSIYYKDGNSYIRWVKRNGQLDKDLICKYIDNRGFLLLDNSIEKVDQEIFKGNEDLKRITGKGVTEVGKSAFEGCEKLESVFFEKIEKIGDYAFAGNANLIFDNFSNLDNLKHIGEGAFSGCKRFESNGLYNVIEIGDIAFMNCENLTKLTIPLIEELGDRVFDGCSNLGEIITSEDKCEYVYNRLTEEQKKKIKVKDKEGNVYQPIDKNSNIAIVEDGSKLLMSNEEISKIEDNLFQNIDVEKVIRLELNKTGNDIDVDEEILKKFGMLSSITANRLNKEGCENLCRKIPEDMDIRVINNGSEFKSSDYNRAISQN